MKLFNSIQNDLARFGFNRTFDNGRYYPFNNQHWKITLTFNLGIVSILLFGVEVADSPKEYMDSFFVEILTVAIYISYTTMIFQTPKLFGIFDSYEKFENECK